MPTTVTTAIVVGIFSVVSATVSAITTYHVASLQNQANNKRIEADYIFERKINSLIDLNSCLQDFHRELAMAEADVMHGDPDEIYPELQTTLYDCIESLSKAEVFLNKEQTETIYDFLNSCRAKAAYLEWQLLEDSQKTPESADFEKENYDELYNNISSIMQKELREPLQDLKEK